MMMAEVECKSIEYRCDIAEFVGGKSDKKVRGVRYDTDVQP
jgi:hypothetical protein